MFERDRTAGLGFDGVAIFGETGWTPKSQTPRLTSLSDDDLHQGELAEVEWLPWGDLEPMAAGEELGCGLDDVFLVATAAEQADAKAGDDAGALADVGADDDVAAVGGAAFRIAFDADW